MLWFGRKWKVRLMTVHRLSEVWMTIFFGAFLGKSLGNLTVKRPFSMVALMCSFCAAMKGHSEVHSRIYLRKHLLVHLEGAEWCARTFHGAVRVQYIPSLHDLQIS